MKRLKSIVLAAVAVLVGVLITVPTPVAAQSAALSIIPKKNYTIEPGKSVRDTLTIRNLDDENTLDLTLRIVDFTFTDDSGAPKLFLDEDAPQTTWSMKPFLEVPETVSIAPKKSVTLDMDISIPANQGAGSFYSAIVYSSGASDGGNVGLSASGVTLVFTTIPGEVDEKLTLKNFGPYRGASKGQKADYMSWFNVDMPERMAYTLENGGNVTEAPVGSITLRHMFGQEITITNVNPNKSLALIGQTRTFSSCIKQQKEEIDFAGSRSEATACVSPGLWPGLYTATLDLYYGQNGNNTEEVKGTTFFWYLPWWFIIAFLIAAAFIAFQIRKLVRRIRYGKPYGGLRRSPRLRRRR